MEAEAAERNMVAEGAVEEAADMPGEQAGEPDEDELDEEQQQKSEQTPEPHLCGLEPRFAVFDWASIGLSSWGRRDVVSADAI